MTLKTNSTKWIAEMPRDYTNQAQSGTTYSTPGRGKTEMDVLRERVMMIAQRLVAAEKEIQALKAKVK